MRDDAIPDCTRYAVGPFFLSVEEIEAVRIEVARLAARRVPPFPHSRQPDQLMPRRTVRVDA